MVLHMGKRNFKSSNSPSNSCKFYGQTLQRDLGNCLQRMWGALLQRKKSMIIHLLLGLSCLTTLGSLQENHSLSIESISDTALIWKDRFIRWGAPKQTLLDAATRSYGKNNYIAYNFPIDGHDIFVICGCTTASASYWEILAYRAYGNDCITLCYFPQLYRPSQLKIIKKNERTELTFIANHGLEFVIPIK